MNKTKDAIVDIRDDYLHLGKEIDINVLHSLYVEKKSADSVNLLIVNNSTEAKFNLTRRDLKELIVYLEYVYEEMNPNSDKVNIAPIIPLSFK